ncbi:MAG: hypothetical protein AAGA66_02310 [Bacteroidota bacterium]
MAQYKHQQRTNGDTILAEEWNNMGLKVESINEKFNEESALISGQLTVSERLTTKALQVTSNMEVNDSLDVGSSLTVSGVTSLAGRLQVDNEGLVGRSGSQLKIGHVGHNKWAGIAHATSANATSYALMQHENGQTLLNTAAGRNLHFREGNKDQLVIKSGGNVGIGTNNPQQKLHIATLADCALMLQTLDNKWLYTNWMDKSSVRRTWMGLNGNLDGFYINVQNGTDKIILNGGNVGIGTGAPQGKLEVKGEAIIGSTKSQLKLGLMGEHTNNYAGIAHASSATTLGYALLQHQNGTTFLNSANGRNLHIRESNVDRITIKSGGNVGIGNTNPQAKLHVLGEVLGAARDAGGNALKVYAGRTGSDKWIQYRNDPKHNGIHVSIDLSHCKFTSTPYVVTSLSGSTSHWTSSGASEPYNVSKTGFTIYIQLSGITPATAKSRAYQVNWIAIGK